MSRLANLEIRRSFDLSASIKGGPDFSRDAKGRMRAPDMIISAELQWQFVHVLRRIFDTYHEDLRAYWVEFPEPSQGEEMMRLDITQPDNTKSSNIAEQRAIYDSLERFIRRLQRENTCTDYIRQENDYALGTGSHLYYKPIAMIGTLHSLVHKVYRGDEDCIAHLYKARHLLERYEDYIPACRMN